MENYNIHEIEALTEEQLSGLAAEKTGIKGHTIYFVDFGGYFGYSCCVFHSGHHVYYANDYQLHHPGKTAEELHDLYLKEIESKLFTDEEIGEPLTSYEEYRRKESFLRNYYVMRTDYVSLFHIAGTDEEEAARKKKLREMYYDPISFAAVPDSSFVDRHIELFEALETAKKATVTNYEYQKNAFLTEMFNHEYGINWDADRDTLSAFGTFDRSTESIEECFAQLKFNDIQKRAYADARSEYYATASF